jgi:uncharacterized protein DUF4340
LSWRQIGVLYVVAALLGAWYLGREWHVLAPHEETGGRARLLSPEVAAADELRMARRDRHLVARRVEGRWTVHEPPGADVPADLLTALVEALAGADVIQRVGDVGGEGTAFGLDEQAVTIELVAREQKPVALRLGAINPGGTAVYAQRVGSRDVVLIGRNVRYYEDLIFDALGPKQGPVVDETKPVGG